LPACEQASGPAVDLFGGPMVMIVVLSADSGRPSLAAIDRPKTGSFPVIRTVRVCGAIPDVPG
jgi:hypothetical protein